MNAGVVDEDDLAALRGLDAQDAEARRLGLVRDDGDLLAEEAVEQGGFTDVGLILARAGLFSASGNARPTGFHWRISSTFWAVLVVLAFGLAAAVQLKRGARPLDNDPLTRAVLQFSRKGESLIFISHSPSAQFPRTLQTERKLGSRYVYHYPLFNFQGLGKKDPEKARREEQLYLDELRSDIVQNRPRLIFINQDDWPPDFTGRLAEVLGHYRLLNEWDGKFAVYRRMGI